MLRVGGLCVLGDARLAEGEDDPGDVTRCLGFDEDPETVFARARASSVMLPLWSLPTGTPWLPTRRTLWWTQRSPAGSPSDQTSTRTVQARPVLCLAGWPRRSPDTAGCQDR